MGAVARFCNVCRMTTRDDMPGTSGILGAVLAGGLSTRFGSDKALALLDGRRLLDHAVAMLANHCDDVVVIGRTDAAYRGVADWPTSGLGPLGGLAGALRHAREAGYDFVLSCAVDSIGLPPDLVAVLSPGPACLASQPVVGLWPVAAADELAAILTGPGKHSVHRFAEAVAARAVKLDKEPVNINHRTDLERLAKRRR